jgi:hypothetical protein
VAGAGCLSDMIATWHFINITLIEIAADLIDLDHSGAAS